ncbi:MAG: hypothetical protein GX605_11665 [Chloroflexi bacterium]|nr:hypothetical protein [Chloroflexota bacterium]
MSLGEGTARVEWLPPRSWGMAWPALAALNVGLMGEAALVFWLSRRPLGLPTFYGALAVLAGLAALAALAWWLWGYWSLRYWLTRNAVTIGWAGRRLVIPLGAIQAVERGASAGPDRRWRPLRQPGYWVGPWRSVDGRVVQCFATAPLEQQVLLHTSAGLWGLSPTDPEAFLARLEAERRLGPTRQERLACRWQGPWGWAFWRDRWAWAAWGAGLLGHLVFWQRALALRSGGDAPLWGLAAGLAAGLLGAALYGQDRTAARWLWVGAAWLQWAGALLVWRG